MTVELPPTIQRVLFEVVEALETIGQDVVVVGALATFAWGEPRTTRDVDIAVHSDLEEGDAIRSGLEDRGFDVEGPLSTAFGPRLLVVTDAGVDVDIFLEPDGGIFERSRSLEIDGHSLQVAAPEDIIALKLHNADRFPEARAQDLEDASGILFKQWDRIDEQLLESLCRDHDTGDLLDTLVEEVARARGEHGLGT